jgi:hypothetical protein
MAKSEFFSNVRTAVRSLAPRVEADNPYTDSTRLERALRGATVWLTPKAVEGFEIKDFGDLPPGERNALAEHVRKFLKVARTVAPQEAAAPEQLREAVPQFLDIVVAVQKMMRDEWVAAARWLVDQATGWAQARAWPTQRYSRQISEDLIGTYQLDKLVFAVEGSQLVLNPLGRFAPGADGMFDLAVLPVYESVMVVRRGSRWYIHPMPREDNRREWSEAAFVETAGKLARLA